MTVRREETARGARIVVPLGGVDHVLSIERATELRDGLAAALTSDQDFSEFLDAVFNGPPSLPSR